MVPQKTEIEKQIQSLAEKIDNYGGRLINASETLQKLVEDFSRSLRDSKKKAIPAFKDLWLEFEIWMLKKQLKKVEDEIQKEYLKQGKGPHSSE